MMTNKQIIRHLIIFILFSSVVIISGYSQGIDINSGRQKRIYMGLNISPAYTTILNEGTTPIDSLRALWKISASGSFELGFLLSKYFGIETGIGYSSYTGNLKLETYSTQYDTTDVAEELYNRRIKGEDITEIQQAGFIKIPVLLNFNIPIADNLGIFFQPGVDLCFPMSKKYSSTGTFTYTGYYYDYKALIHGVGFEGFEDTCKNEKEGELKLNSFNTELNISAGLIISINKNLQLAIGFNYSRFINNISGYDVPKSYILSSYPEKVSSLMEGSTKATAQAVGLRVGFRYFIK